MIGKEEKTVKAKKGVILTLGGFEFNEDFRMNILSAIPLSSKVGSTIQLLALRWLRMWSQIVAHGYGYCHVLYVDA